MVFACKVELPSIKKSSIFIDGAESLIVVLGIVWLSATIIGAHIPEIKETAGNLLREYPTFICHILLY
ncbi:anaerobic C4-dicarboxylate transporter family protein [Campylobacter hyointestinalis]|nr:anaerobic C4-dicarboxylate transporter family protein [Campylobacter hyointestinalis]